MPVVGSYVRIGFNQKGLWLLNKLRSDFSPSIKIQTEDDISASITLPRNKIKNLPDYGFNQKWISEIENCKTIEEILNIEV